MKDEIHGASRVRMGRMAVIAGEQAQTGIGPKPRGSWLEHLPAWTKRLGSIGALPGDTEDERLHKAALVLTVIMVVAMAVIWVATYMVLGLYVSAAIPLGYQVISIGSLVALARTGRFGLFRGSQLALMLLLPIFLQWSLGGFVASSGVMLWSLISPVGALIFSPRPQPWFWGYLALTLSSGVVDPFLTPVTIAGPINVAFFVLNVGGVSAVAYFVLRYAMRGIAVERQKSEMLLLNVLPAPIARRLKNGEQPLADRFEEAGVLFADLVEFTPMAEGLAPEKVVEFLDGLFSQFDEIADRHRLEKIKTVGDAYMVVGGLPERAADAAEAVAEMALELQEVVARRLSPTGKPLRLRIGIDIGPVVAGVIGKRKFSYDLWGDTVNTASRMEAYGIPGKIQVTPRAYERLRRRYRFEPRGPVDVKGKGEMLPHLLVGRLEETRTI